MSPNRHGAVVGALLSALVMRSAAAQCPDGTAPPCRRGAPEAAATSRPPAERDRARTFLVLPFRNLSRIADYQWLVEASPTMLADALGKWTELTVVPDERLYPALRRHELHPGDVMDLASLRPGLRRRDPAPGGPYDVRRAGHRRRPARLRPDRDGVVARGR